MIKNIIFDWAGTLNDSFHCFCKAVDIVFEKLGAEKITEDQKREINIPYMKFWNKHFPSLTKEEQDRLYQEAFHQVNDAEFYQGVKETLNKLADSGIKLFVVSSDHHSTLLLEAKKECVHDLFIEIVAHVHHKDETLKKLVEKHNLIPEETVYIGDTTGDIYAGKEVGLQTIAITWGFHSEEKLKTSKPDYVIHNIRDLEQFGIK